MAFVVCHEKNNIMPQIDDIGILPSKTWISINRVKLYSFHEKRMENFEDTKLHHLYIRHAYTLSS